MQGGEIKNKANGKTPDIKSGVFLMDSNQNLYLLLRPFACEKKPRRANTPRIT